MFTLSTHIELPIAHRLPSAYSGLCVGNVSQKGAVMYPADTFGCVHGHNYNITIKVSAGKTDDDYMVMDFKKVKKIIHEILDPYDHSLILKEGDELIDFYLEGFENRNVDIKDSRVFVWQEAPTAEYMAYTWYHVFKERFCEEGLKVEKMSITVEETSNNSVTYEED